ncbi:MAG: RDD family protein [Alphaproteobacteria bacterium]|nr:RDD family protein [Alphaproteobacteria bacterium]
MFIKHIRHIPRFMGSHARQVEQTWNQFEHGNLPHGIVCTGFWVRFWAFLFDTLFVYIIWVSIIIALVPLKGHAWVHVSNFLIYGIICQVIYTVALTASPLQATLGKRLLGIYIHQAHSDKPIGLGRSLLRAVAFWLSFFTGVGVMMVGLHHHKQGLHDVIADTVVVYRNS